MQSAHIVRESAVNQTPRLRQLSGLFDVTLTEKSRVEWDVALPLGERDWNIGLIVGPSGCGKSTIAREFWPDGLCEEFDWSPGRSVIDDFPATMSIKEITALLSSVGFSSPPSWLRPFHVLSTGEQFRTTMARLIAEAGEISVVDEFTSTVDRAVAKTASHAIAKTIRKRDQKFIAITCHNDIEEWLCPDWVYLPHVNELSWRSVRRRPPINLRIRRVHRSAWRMFAQHHYLNHNLHKAATCFVAFWAGCPVAFCAYMHLPNPRVRNIKRGHRLVCLPDYQGCGISGALNEVVASLLKVLGYRFVAPTSHPALISALRNSANWRMLRPPRLSSRRNFTPTKKCAHLSADRSRYSATFEYYGPAGDIDDARRLLGDVKRAKRRGRF